MATKEAVLSLRARYPDWSILAGIHCRIQTVEQAQIDCGHRCERIEGDERIEPIKRVEHPHRKNEEDRGHDRV